ncbi:MAG: hypothetical protein R3F56_25955 [Planctomycetota bacterium]
MAKPALSVLFAVGCLVAVSPRAQSGLPIPTLAAFTEGNDLTSYPFGRTAFRAQQVVHGSAIAPNNATINALGYRADNDNSANKPAVSIANVQIDLSPTTVDQLTMSTTYAQNITGTVTTVFSGTVNLPAYNSTEGGVAPWGPVIPITPFSFTTAGLNNLLIDITATGANASSGYTLDSALPGGQVRFIGQSGPTSDPFARLQTLVSANGATQGRFSALVPGGSVTLFGQSDTQPFVGQMMIALSRLATPVDLTFLGAPNNELYQMPDLQLPFTMAGLIRYQAPFTLNIPALPTLTGANLYAQCWVVDVPANSLGIVTSNGVELTIGQAGDHPTRVVRGTDPLAATGAFNYVSGIYGGAVLQLTGAFN